MREKGMTTIALKKINRDKVYQYIYRQKETSKLQIVQDLQMGLSTVPPKRSNCLMKTATITIIIYLKISNDLSMNKAMLLKKSRAYPLPLKVSFLQMELRLLTEILWAIRK